MTGDNKAVSSNLRFSHVSKLSSAIHDGHFSTLALASILLHLGREIVNPHYRTRRPFLQPLLSFPIYQRLLKRTKPDFSTFFTNHVAGSIHRYWRYLFPSDSSTPLAVSRRAATFHSHSNIKGLDIVDKQIASLLPFLQAENGTLLLASSMGQQAIDRGSYVPELLLQKPRRLLALLGLSTAEYVSVPAMQPDYCFHCSGTKARDDLIKAVSTLLDSKGSQVVQVRYYNTGNVVNLILKHSLSASQSRELFIDGKPHSLSSLGFALISRDPGTGYHNPEGFLLSYGHRQEHFKSDNHVLDTTRISPLILSFFGVPAPGF